MAKAGKDINKKLIDSGFNTNDLSVEKRNELANDALTAALDDIKARFSVALDVELLFNKKGIVPRLVWLDVKPQKKDETTKETTKE